MPSRTTAGIPRFQASSTAESAAEAVREQGAVIVEGVLGSDLLARFNAEIDPILEQVSPVRSYLNPAIDYFYGDRVRQVTGMAARSRIFAEEILCHPFYAAVSATDWVAEQKTARRPDDSTRREGSNHQERRTCDS